MNNPKTLATLYIHDIRRRQNNSLKDEQHRPHQNQKMNPSAREGETVPAPHKTLTMLLI
jgi:hypothetical protein